MPTQLAIRRWFNRTYSTKGLEYLRPVEFYAVFLEYLGVSPGQRLLDIGCGPGLLLTQAAKYGARAEGVDVSETALVMAQSQAPGAGLGVSNAEALCFRRGTFDYITCIGVFEHFLDPDRALSEMKRVTKAEGRICIMVPNSRTLKWKIEGEWLRLHDEDSNERAATFEEWRDIFLRNGLTIEHVYRDEWPAYQRQRRFLGRHQEFTTYATSSRHFLPQRYANQFVFMMRPAQ